MFGRRYFLSELSMTEIVKEFGRPACSCLPSTESPEYHTKFNSLSKQWQVYRLRIVEKFQLQVPHSRCYLQPVLLEAFLRPSEYCTPNFLRALELTRAMGRCGCECAELLLALQALHTSSASAAGSTLATFC